MAAENGNRPETSGPPPRREGLAIGKVLMPLAVILGAFLAPAVLSSRQVGWSQLWSWLIGGPAGAVAGMLAALVVLVAINATLRLMGRR